MLLFESPFVWFESYSNSIYIIMKVILFVALPSELPKEVVPNGIEVHYTGVGKVNAAIKATETLKDLDPTNTIVINYGSAGGHSVMVGNLFKCKTFVQNAVICDMESYSIAKVCKIYGFDFTAYKYVSDSGNPDDWQVNHNKGIEMFLDKLKNTP